MTLGQRIAQKRKELGLSQEGLGEQLGVSRQAIYKWESDASLPEIEKLITLSRIFSVPVGWLLGVEEVPRDEPASPPGELTEEQLAMVREIVDGYLAAQPKPASPGHRRLLARLCGGAAAAALVAVLFTLFSKLDLVTQEYNSLRYSVNDVNRNVNSQISSITSRVEEILKSQNNLMAEWSAELASTDPGANTASFDVRAVPRTYVEGMTAVFVARSGENTAELPVEAGADGSFTGRLTCPLADQIDVSVVLVTGDKRETQWLDDFYDLYSSTFPSLRLDSTPWFEVDDESSVLRSQISTERSVRHGFGVLDNEDQYNSHLGWYPEPPAKLQVGLFRDRKLLLWYQGGIETTSWNGAPREEYIWRRPQDVVLEPGHEYCEAAVYTDEYGRQYVYPGEGLSYNEGWVPFTPYDDGLTGWEF